MKYLVLISIGLAFYFMTATQMVMTQLDSLKDTYQSFDELSQQIAVEK